MKIGIVGAGFTGLSAATDLVRQGHQITVFEAAPEPGGLAAGFQNTGWDWTIEKHYHHVFTTDSKVKNWLTELGLVDNLVYRRVKTATLFGGKSRSLDSVLSLLNYQPLSLTSRVRLGFGLALLKFWPWGSQLDKWAAAEWIRKIMGQESWLKVWRPLFLGKFGRFAEKINLAWFWARIVARSSALGIYRGGFGRMANDVTSWLKSKGVVFRFATPVQTLKKTRVGWQLTTQAETANFDKILIAAESRVAAKLMSSAATTLAQQNWLKKITKLTGLGAITMVLELDQPFFHDESYWLNINESGWPFLAVVEQTKLTGTQPFANHSVLYVGKYGEVNGAEGMAWFHQTDEEIFQKYLPYLKKLNSDFELHLISRQIFKEGFAQPLVFINHRKNVPAIETPWNNLYWASMQHVYPWDRGINFAVDIGRKAADQILKIKI